MDFSFRKYFARRLLRISYYDSNNKIDLPSKCWNSIKAESFCDIAHCIGRNPTTIMGIWNQWVAEYHTEWQARYERPLMTNDRKNRHIVRLALQNCTTTSWTIIRKWTCFQQAQYPLVLCDYVCSSMNRQHGDHYSAFPWQCSIERDGNWCTERQNWRSEDNVCRLLTFDIGIRAQHLMCWFEQPLSTLNIHL